MSVNFLVTIADDIVDGEICATDLLGQAEHGYDSPAILITNSKKLAESTLSEIERILKILPTKETASISWRDYGEIILCDSYEEMLDKANEIVIEKLQALSNKNKKHSGAYCC